MTFTITQKIEAFFTPVALGLVTYQAFNVFTRRTYHGGVHTVGLVGTGLMAVCTKPNREMDGVSMNTQNFGKGYLYGGDSLVEIIFTFQANDSPRII